MTTRNLTLMKLPSENENENENEKDPNGKQVDKNSCETKSYLFGAVQWCN